MDTDTLLHEDPSRWMVEHADHYFVATRERALRGYPGFNSHLVFLEPNARVFDLLRAAAVHGHFVRCESAAGGESNRRVAKKGPARHLTRGLDPATRADTGTDQDVIEQLFAPLQSLPRLPPNTHSKTAGWCESGAVYTCARRGGFNCSVHVLASGTCCPRAFEERTPHCCTPRLGCCDSAKAKWHTGCQADHAAGKPMNSRCQAILERAGIRLDSDRTLGRDLAHVLYRTWARGRVEA
jgi:hypothetical protein